MNRFQQLISLATEPDGPVDNILFEIIKLITSDPDFHYRQKFLLESLNSQRIVKLLSYLENESERVRKLALLFFALIVSNSRSKIYFLEKCGFGLSFGKVLITRLKYLQNAIPRHMDQATVVKSFIQTVNLAKKSGRQALFWYVPLMTLEESNLRVVYFFESVLENKMTMDFLVDVVPDSVENMCGFEFSEWDLPESARQPNLLLSEPPRPIASVSVEELDYRQKVRSTKQRNQMDRSEDFSDVKNSQQVGLSPANKSVTRKPKPTANEVLQKYRSSIKDRTPSLNVKKDGTKLGSIVLGKRTEPSPIRTPKASETAQKLETKVSIKSQKISEILQKSKPSKSPTVGESRSNVNEKLSKILGPRTKA